MNLKICILQKKILCDKIVDKYLRKDDLNMRVLNFSAGPSQLPEYVLEKIKDQMMDYEKCGQSVMEMSHRSQEFKGIIEKTEKRLRKLMNIPDNYKVLFLQGGGSLQFTMIPVNLFGENKKAAVVNTGAWSKKAAAELKRLEWIYGHETCVIAASSEEDNFSYIPKGFDIPEGIDYLYICENNTIYGTKYKKLPDTKGVKLVADLSSCILSEPVNVSDYALIFAGAQKNMGIAGLTVVIIREDLIKKDDRIPAMLSYYVHADKESMYNTPPTFSIYVMGLVLEWIEKEFGTLEKLGEVNRKKADLLYDYLDNSQVFRGTAAKEDRSLMNVPFVTEDKNLDAEFIDFAKKKGFVNIKGHRSVGGMRASIYNAMPYEAVEKLVECMKEFEKGVLGNV